jgi:hypothetical protein
MTVGMIKSGMTVGMIKSGMTVGMIKSGMTVGMIKSGMTVFIIHKPAQFRLQMLVLRFLQSYVSLHRMIVPNQTFDPLLKRYVREATDKVSIRRVS